jgi:hypothetical protein
MSGRSLQIKGEVIGSESLYIDGKVEGAINLPDSRVTVGRYAQVLANITAPRSGSSRERCAVMSMPATVWTFAAKVR